MEEKLKKILSKANYEPESSLAFNIWSKIKIEEKQRARRNLWLLLVFGVTSLSGMVPIVGTVLKDLSNSGFYEYLSLAFSNSEIIFLHGKELFMSLIESLPVMSIASSLFLMFIFFFSIREAGKQIKSAALSF